MKVNYPPLYFPTDSDKSRKYFPKFHIEGSMINSKLPTQISSAQFPIQRLVTLYLKIIFLIPSNYKTIVEPATQLFTLALNSKSKIPDTPDTFLPPRLLL